MGYSGARTVIVFKQMLKVSAFYLEKQKSFIPLKNKILGRCQYQNKKTLFTDPIFSEGFAGSPLQKPDFYHHLMCVCAKPI